ncbi:MAG: BlaI/MecI/CopY family transcriptional regulator [Planctomycetota bacterium]
MGDPLQLGDLQLAVLQTLQEEGEATASALHALLRPRQRLARTTIATVLTKLEGKGVVARRRVGRQDLWRATLGERELRRSLVGDLVARVFAGDAAELVNHLLVERELAGTDLERLKGLIAAAEPRGEKSRGD